jgi:hypothetical protein
VSLEIDARWAREWRKANPERGHIGRARRQAKKRKLGFIPINKCFVGCEVHHINQNDVIYIPKELHQSVHHNIWTGKNMEKINALAFEYLRQTTSG